MTAWEDLLSECETRGDAQRNLNAILNVVLRDAAGFDRRVAKRLLGNFDYRTLIFAKRGPGTVCEERRACSRALLDADNERLNDASKKARYEINKT